MKDGRFTDCEYCGLTLTSDQQNAGRAFCDSCREWFKLTKSADDFQTNDTNRLSFTDTGGTVRTFPFVEGDK